MRPFPPHHVLIHALNIPTPAQLLLSFDPSYVNLPQDMHHLATCHKLYSLVLKFRKIARLEYFFYSSSVDQNESVGHRIYEKNI